MMECGLPSLYGESRYCVRSGIEYSESSPTAALAARHAILLAVFSWARSVDAHRHESFSHLMTNVNESGEQTCSHGL